MNKHSIRILKRWQTGFMFILSALATFNILMHFSDSEQTLHILHISTFVSIFLLILDIYLSTFQQKKIFPKILYYFLDLFFISILLFVKETDDFFQFYLFGRQSVIFIKHYFAKETKETTIIGDLAKNPPVFLMLSFILIIFLGTLLLVLPNATAPHHDTSLIGAIFTSTSATCVTGLVVYDTGTQFSLFGQLVILLLIQIGGLGIMTISSALALIIGQKLTMRSENLLQNVIGESNKVDMLSLVKNILFMTIFFEALGAIYLIFTYRSMGWGTYKSFYHAVFHSVSAFCNAGFSLYPDSLIKFQTNININFVITSLIILGGIGFPVINNIKNNFRNKFKFSRLSLHTKIVLLTTSVLIILGTVAFFFSEYNHEMKSMNLGNRIMASYFQSVTTRTAGFNTIDNSTMSKGSVFMSILLMFIGASPGSTGGGIKTTTFAIIVLSVFALISGNRDVNVFKRKIKENTIKRVMALIAISITLLSVFIFILLINEDFSFDEIVFEAFSAFGTVGLSMGITPNLSNLGQIIIITLMYLGRVGPLTLIFAISERNPKVSYTYVEEKISIG